MCAYLATMDVSSDPSPLWHAVPHGDADVGQQLAQVRQAARPVLHRHLELHQPPFRRQASFKSSA